MTRPHPLATLERLLPDETATVALAQQLADLVCCPSPSRRDAAPGSSGIAPQPPMHGLTPGGRIHLRGELGAGKTALARALLRRAGVTGRIKSPSYALLESYNVSNLYFYHFDFYRFSDAHEWRDAGFDELLKENAVILVEWPEQAGTRLPPPDLDVSLSYAGNGRNAFLSAYSEKGQLWLKLLSPLSP